MPTIIDSLFLELGVDTTKFSKDQARALRKIQQFESQVKNSARGARGGIKTVGDAFRDLAKESSVGASAERLDNLATKFKNLGISMSVSSGAGVPLGAMTRGLGMLLSPAALGIAALGLLTKGAWDLNKEMTAANSTIFRQSQLSNMNADSLWAWGEAAKAVGANPQDVTGGIASVQTAIAGMMVGAGNAAPQLAALSRLGLGWNVQSGLSDAQVAQMFARVHAMAAARGYKNLGGLRALTGPIMNDAMFALATSRNFNPATMQSQIKAMEPANLGAILQNSLKSQEVLGKLGIRKDILAETAYGGEQGLMQAIVQLLTSLLDATTKILGYIEDIAGWVNSLFGGSKPTTATTSSKGARAGMASAMQMLIAGGLSESDAAAAVGNMMQESAMNPLATNASGHTGLMQWNKTRQAAFAKQFGYQMGSGGVPASKQFTDELAFAVQELKTTHNQALAKMAQAQSLMTKTSAFMRYDEIVNDPSFSRRFGFAQEALQLKGARGGTQNTVTNDVRIGDVIVNTPSTDPRAHAAAVRLGLTDHPLLNPQGTISLGTRGMVQ